jgi:hypothetical protein
VNWLAFDTHPSLWDKMTPFFIWLKEIDPFLCLCLVEEIETNVLYVNHPAIFLYKVLVTQLINILPHCPRSVCSLAPCHDAMPSLAPRWHRSHLTSLCQSRPTSPCQYHPMSPHHSHTSAAPEYQPTMPPCRSHSLERPTLEPSQHKGVPARHRPCLVQTKDLPCSTVTARCLTYL